MAGDMGGPEIESIALARKSEIISRPELLPTDNRETVLNAFNRGFELYKDWHDKTKPAPNSPEEWQFKALEASRKQSVEATTPEDSITQKFQNLETGKWYHQAEGNPTEHLLKFLGERRQQLLEELKDASLSDTEKEALNVQLGEVNNCGRVIYRNSVRYAEVPGRMEEGVLLGRVRLEANLASQDSRDKGSENANYFLGENTLGVPAGNRSTESLAETRNPWFQAATTINGRLELLIPPAEGAAAPDPTPRPDEGTPADDRAVPPATLRRPPPPPGWTPPTDGTPPADDLPEDDEVPPAAARPLGPPPPPPPLIPDPDDALPVDAAPTPDDDFLGGADGPATDRDLAPIAGASGPPTPGATPATPDTTTPPVERPDVWVAAIGRRDSDHWKNAREWANKLIAQEQKNGRWYNIWKKVGLSTMFEEHFRQKITRELFEVSRQSGNSYLSLDLARSSIPMRDLLRGTSSNLAVQVDQNRTAAEVAGQAKVTDIKNQAREGIDASGREVQNRRDILEATGGVKRALISEIIRPIAEGRASALFNPPRAITTPQDIQEALRAFALNHRDNTDINELFGKSTSEIGQNAQTFATDILELAQNVREDVAAHRYGLDAIDAHTKILLANTAWAGNTEAHRTSVDRFLIWAEQRRLRNVPLGGLLANPTFVSVAFGLGTFAAARTGTLAKWGVVGAGFAAAGPAGLLAGAAAGGIYAAFKRDRNLKMDRATTNLDETYGGARVTRATINAEINARGGVLARTPDWVRSIAGAYRRADLQEVNYKQANASDLLDRLNQSLSADLNVATNQQAALNNIAEISARLALGQDQKIDLIRYESKTGVEQSRMQMVQAMVQARRTLMDSAGLSRDQVRQLEHQQFNAQLNTLGADQTTKDRQFFYDRLRQSTINGVVGASVGVAAGLIGQESWAVIKRLAGSPTGDTILEQGIQALQGQKAWSEIGSPTQASGFAKEVAEKLYKNPGSTALGSGITMDVDASHNVSFKDSTGAAINVPGAHLNADGSIAAKVTPDKLPANLRGIITDTNHWEAPKVTKGADFGLENGKEFYNKPFARTEVAPNLYIESGVNNIPQVKEAHALSFSHGAQYATAIEAPPMHLYPDGHVTLSGSIDQYPSEIRDFIKAQGWTEVSTPTHTGTDLAKNIKELYNKEPNLDHVFRHGNTEINLRGTEFSLTNYPKKGPDGDTIQIFGKINADGTLSAPRDYLNNAGLTNEQWTRAQALLKAEAWGAAVDGKGAGGGNVVDAMLAQSPDALRARGIIETDQFNKTWNFHVLRPDIVSKTGMHTHNELTMHLGGKYDVLNPNGSTTPRVGVGQIGVVNFGGELQDKLIPSNLSGVEAQKDPVLNELLRRSGGLKLDQLVAVVDLTNGKQIMLPLDANGNAQLPAELYDPTTGAPRGVQSIATGVMQKADGTILPSKDILASGQIPQGSVMHSLASERFAEVAAPPAQTETLKLTPPHIKELVPPNNNETIFTPKPAEMLEAPPAIPFDFAPRHPLDRSGPGEPRDRDTVYGGPYAYEQLSPATQEFYRQRLSERLRNNPNANLNAEEEIPDYFARQSPEYMAQLEQYLNQEGMREPMSDNCDAIACIPVYSLGEGKVIQNALEQYLLQVDKTRNNQAIDPSKFELILFMNYPKPKLAEIENGLGKPITDGAETRVRSGNPEQYDTEEVVKQFQAAHPELNIRIMKQEFPERPVWGKIIKPAYDAALLRAMRRSNPVHKDPVIITNDIDVVDMSPTYMRDILQTMDLNEISSDRNTSVRKLDGIVGKIDMPNHGYEKMPGFLAAERLYQYLDAQVRRGRNPITQGRSTILRASSYAAIGGVNESTDAGGDTELGRMINTARNGAQTLQYQNKVWLHTDPRREVDMWAKGIPLAYAWDEWSAMNVYGKDWKARFSTPPGDPTRIDRNFLELEIAAEMRRWGLSPSSPEMIRALQFMGLKPGDYHSEKRHDARLNQEIDWVVIDRVDGLTTNLQQYVDQERWKAIERRKEAALKAPQVAEVGDNMYAEFGNYEEFDRIYSDIFVSNEYPWTPDATNPSPTIIDLGSHMGMSVMRWKQLAPGAKIKAVEANPKTFEMLKRNVSRNDLKDVSVVQAAATNTPGTVTLNLPKDGVDFRWGDFVGTGPVDPTKYDTVDVPSVQLSSLITGPTDLLKVDIEGSELGVLKEAESKLPLVKEIMLEFHNDPANPANSYRETLDLLQRQGYNVEVRLWNQPIDKDSVNIAEKNFYTILAKR